MNSKIKTKFQTIGGKFGERQVRYLTSGSGPVIFLLHQSPKSADEYKPLMKLWSNDFCMIAPDTPGFGSSDPLESEKVTIEEIAEATIELADALGIDRFGLYGFHTGAIISIALAHKFSNRIEAVSCNGVLVLTDDELEKIRAEYLPPFEPRWDGGHLSWLWSRMREQLVFFPWHERTKVARMKFSISDPLILHENAVDVMRAGDNYRSAYGAAFEYRLENFVPELKVPALITAGEWDPLCKCLEDLTPSRSTVIESSKDQDQALEKSRAHLLKHSKNKSIVLPECAMKNNGLTRSVIETSVGDICIQKNFDQTDENPLVIIPPIGGSSKTIKYLSNGLSKEQKLIVIDLPGHGESVKDIKEPILDCFNQAVSDVIDDQRIKYFTLAIINHPGSLSQLINEKNARINHLILIEPWFVDRMFIEEYIEKGLPDIKKEWHGGHLNQYWYMVRDSKLFWPWYNTVIDGIMDLKPQLDETQLQDEVTELIRSESNWISAMIGSLNASVNIEIDVKTTVCYRENHPLSQLPHKKNNFSKLQLDDEIRNWSENLKTIL
tara:strand:+ start:513 stop:2168 length:1656 start_codon:yes stop_codon:yes gene_type:complete